MTPVSHFSLESHEGHYESWPLKSKLFRDGLPTGTSVPGYVIEGQYTVGQKFLLVTSYDCPFEESNSFILLDRTCRVVAHKHVGAWYCSFSIQNLQPVSANELLITYHGGDQSRLAIRDPRPFLRSYFRLDSVSEAKTLRD